jgi:hypothetical protein
LPTGLEVELIDHLGYEPHAVEGPGSGNSRNDSYRKTVTTDIGKVDVRVRRDRSGSFDPVTVPEGQRRLTGLSTNVISLYAKGMMPGEIQVQLFDVHGTEISRDTISRITDAIVEDLIAWQNRPLDPIYPVVLIAARAATTLVPSGVRAPSHMIGHRRPRHAHRPRRQEPSPVTGSARCPSASLSFTVALGRHYATVLRVRTTGARQPRPVLMNPRRLNTHSRRRPAEVTALPSPVVETSPPTGS